jgi:hypothetical protein
MTTTPTSPRRQARAAPRAGEAEHGASTRRARGWGVVGATAGPTGRGRRPVKHRTATHGTGAQSDHPHLAAQASARSTARRRSRARSEHAPSTSLGGGGRNRRPNGPRTATGQAPHSNARYGGTIRPPPPRRAGKRAQHRAQARDSEPSTERARAEHEVGGWWAQPQAQRAEDGDRSSTAQHRAKRGHQDPGNGDRLSAFVAAVSQLECRSCWGGDGCRWAARWVRRRGTRTLNADGGCGMRDAGCGMRNAERGTRNAERGTRNAERGMRNAGCGMRDAERGTRNAGCGMRDAGCGMRNARR